MLLAPTPTPAPTTTGTPAWVVVTVAVITALAGLLGVALGQWLQGKAERDRASEDAQRADAQAHRAERKELYVRVLTTLEQCETDVGWAESLGKDDPRRPEMVGRIIDGVTTLNAQVSEATLLGASDVAEAVETARARIGDALGSKAAERPDDWYGHWRRAVHKARLNAIETMRADLDTPFAEPPAADRPEAN